MTTGNERVLSYGDVLLRRSDVDLLDGENLLNDNLIEFFFTYLTNQYCKSDTSSAGGQNQLSPLLLVGPTPSFWLLHCPDSESLMAAIDPLRLREREVVIFALNNNEDFETAEGGTHWTLLMFNRQRNTFEHFDSLSGTNYKQAREMVEIIRPHIGATGSKFIDQATPQQENCYDCGVYVMAIAQVLCSAFQERRGSRSRSQDYAGHVRTAITPTSVNSMRYSTMELIYSLAGADNTR